MFIVCSQIASWGYTQRAWWWQKSGMRTLQHIHTVTLWDFRPSHYQVQYCWSICTHNTPPEWKSELSHDLRSLPKITNPLCCLWLTTRWDSPIWRRHWRDLLIIHHYCNPLSLSCCFRRKRMSHAIHCLVIHVINRSSMASLAFFLCPRSLCNLILILFLIIGFDKVYESTSQWTDLWSWKSLKSTQFCSLWWELNNTWFWRVQFAHSAVFGIWLLVTSTQKKWSLWESMASSHLGREHTWKTDLTLQTNFSCPGSSLSSLVTQWLTLNNSDGTICDIFVADISYQCGYRKDHQSFQTLFSDWCTKWKFLQGHGGDIQHLIEQGYKHDSNGSRSFLQKTY